MPNTRRRRDATVDLSRVGGVYWAKEPLKRWRTRGVMCINADFQQIELRIVAHLSNDPTMLALFNQPDSHATDVFKQLTADW